ncbi:hypothetical protein GJ700_27790 [Duganella sp. FT92W]|uniref:Uncharacterized protein n=1 Tax=Pseudoduganella rivuli TaxID=2666085 RepID=A0A7X2LVJ6_9BURK|nr:hypothetical protein [Pseudoduganella rivuli]MRV75526.1 hypothetical protein [Pseudoduganella rivuli]
MIFSYVRQCGNEIAEIHAFPAELTERVKNTVQLLAGGQMHAPSEAVISVRLAGDIQSIPYRVYYEKQQLLTYMNSSDDIALIALCLGTRHYDGFIREQCLRRLLVVEEKWTTPFVVQLLGEYVIEVILPIHEHFLKGVERKYIDFFRENVKYCECLGHRATSYWNEYYRPRFQAYKDYPAVKALAALKLAARPVKGKAALVPDVRIGTASAARSLTVVGQQQTLAYFIK